MSTGARNMYAPIRDGFAQSTYADQMETAYVGMMANASDYNLTDSYIVGEVGPDGLIAGIGVVGKVVDTPTRPGINQLSIELPDPAATADDFEGITVRNDQMGTNSSGTPCMFESEMINVLRKTRVGGRIWVMLSQGTTAFKSAVHWIIADTTGHGHAIGSYSAAEITGDTVELPFAEFKGAFTAPTGGYVPALVEVRPL